MSPGLRRVIGVACDIAADLATGLARTVCAAASTLAIAVLPEPPAVHDPGLEPAGPPRIPAAPAPLPQSAMLDRLAAVHGSGWLDRLDGPVFSPWLPDAWQAPDDASELDGTDGPVAP